jgi:hypothetical protein
MVRVSAIRSAALLSPNHACPNLPPFARGARPLVAADRRAGHWVAAPSCHRGDGPPLPPLKTEHLALTALSRARDGPANLLPKAFEYETHGLSRPSGRSEKNAMYLTRKLKLGRSDQLDRLARRAGGLWSTIAKWHWRFVRRQGYWLSKGQA